MSGLTIRGTAPDDADLIATLIAELAQQQGNSTEHISADTLSRHAFGTTPDFEVLVAERNGAVVGYALFHFAYEPAYSARGIYLSDIYVRPGARRRGIGRALVAAAAARAKQLGRFYVWWVAKDWNEPAKAFYRSLGAISEPVIAHAITFATFEQLAGEGETGVS